MSELNTDDDGSEISLAMKPGMEQFDAALSDLERYGNTQVVSFPHEIQTSFTVFMYPLISFYDSHPFLFLFDVFLRFLRLSNVFIVTQD